MSDSTLKKPNAKFNPSWIWIAIIGGIIIFSYLGGGNSPAEITKKTFLDTLLTSGNINKIIVQGGEVPVVEVFVKQDKIEYYKKDSRWKYIPKKGSQFHFGIPDALDFEKEVRDTLNNFKYPRNIKVIFSEKSNSFFDILLSAIPFILLIFIWIFLMRRMSGGGSGGGGVGGGIFNVGKSKAKLFDKENGTKISFKDVAGLEEAKVEVMEIVDFLKNPKKYNDLGGKIPKGALLVGPPGTGKTMLAKAVAGEAHVPFFSISGSDFVEMFVGVGASRVRDLFKQAKEKSPCIIFIDEIDAIGRARSKNSGWSSNDERENTLNQLLTEMDGFGTNAGVIILAATNRADILDKALLRAGRFDRQIHVDLPELKEREAIFNVHLKSLKLDPTFNPLFLSKQTPGFSGADIANVCNEAALIAARSNKKQVEKQDFLDAVDRIVGGLERRSKIFKPHEKKTIAYHEAGHATVSWFLEYANPLLKVTIIPRGKALGAAWYLPNERNITTKEQMIHEIASLLGGRASEEFNFNQISSGALNDLERTTKQAYAMIAYYGMSNEIGAISYYNSSDQSEMNFTKPYSEMTAQKIDAEVKKLIEHCYKLAMKTLTENKKGMHKLAELLLEKEVILTEDLERIFGKRPQDEEEPNQDQNTEQRPEIITSKSITTKSKTSKIITPKNKNPKTITPKSKTPKTKLEE